MSAVSDRNLLLGILALQMDFVGRDELIDALHAWVANKTHVAASGPFVTQFFVPFITYPSPCFLTAQVNEAASLPVRSEAGRLYLPWHAIRPPRTNLQRRRAGRPGRRGRDRHNLAQMAPAEISQPVLPDCAH